MELQQMRYVLAVAQERNFTRAAQRCHVVQSALSHQIKALERELGMKLFARTSRRVELTAAGAAFVEAAQKSVDAAARAVAQAGAAAGLVRGTLTVGVLPTVTAIDIPLVLGEFHRRHPGVQVRLRGGGSDEFLAAIAGGSMDAAVLGLPDGSPPKLVNTRVLTREKLVAVVSAHHKFSDRRRLYLEDLANEVFVDFPEGTPGRAQSDGAFQAAGIQRDVAFEVMSTNLMLGLVAQGLVVALLPPATVPDSAELRTVPIMKGPVRVQYLAWSAFNPSPATQAFLAGLSV